MSTTVTYKGSALTTVNNQTRTLKTAGKYMEGDIILADTTTDPNAHTVKCILSDTIYTRTIQIGSGTRTNITNGAEYTFNTGDTIVTRVVDGGTIYYNGELVKSSMSTVSYTFAAPSKDLEISCESDKMYIVESEGANIQPLSVTQNGTYTAPSGVDGYSPVTVNVSGGTPNLQNKSVTPSESQQLVTADEGYTGLGTITVNAIPSTYVGSGITQRTSDDLTASGATVSVPAGYYSVAASKSVASGSVTGPTSLSGSSATVTTGTNTLTLTKTGVTTTPTVSAGYVSSATASTATVTLTASVTTKAAATITPTTTNQTIASGTYLTGTQTIAGDADLVGSNILSTANIFGVQGEVVVQNVYHGSSAPGSSTGSNGDIYIQS